MIHAIIIHNRTITRLQRDHLFLTQYKCACSLSLFTVNRHLQSKSWKKDAFFNSYNLKAISSSSHLF
ncbi:hypothetical protein CW304_29105 [Bacillus sp. UFRGS-B20]|nr:hypothetical protein CW304_29105 [Bacillus sp. UFRGS-B20]